MITLTKVYVGLKVLLYFCWIFPTIIFIKGNFSSPFLALVCLKWGTFFWNEGHRDVSRKYLALVSNTSWSTVLYKDVRSLFTTVVRQNLQLQAGLWWKLSRIVWSVWSQVIFSYQKVINPFWFGNFVWRTSILKTCSCIWVKIILTYGGSFPRSTV